MDSLDCTGAGQNVCVTEGPDAGLCVQCTPNTEATHCDGKSCDPVAHACTETPTGSSEACEPCLADSECEPDHYCIALDYAGDLRGSYCLKDLATDCVRPFGIPLAGRASRSGRPATTYCGIVEARVTCEAVRALLDDAVCDTGTDAECPESGLCRRVGGFPNRCTYRCSGDAAACKAAPSSGSTCGRGSPPAAEDYCGG